MVKMMQLSYSEAEYTGKAQADASREVFVRDGSGGAVGLSGRGDCEALSAKRQAWASTVSDRDDAADSLHAAVVWPERSGDGGVAVRQLLDASVCEVAAGRVLDETTILNFRHLLEAHDIAEGIFEGVNLLQDYGLFVRRGIDRGRRRLSRHRVRRRMRWACATPRCIRPRRARTGTLA